MAIPHPYVALGTFFSLSSYGSANPFDKKHFVRFSIRQLGESGASPSGIRSALTTSNFVLLHDIILHIITAVTGTLYKNSKPSKNNKGVVTQW